MRPVDDSVLFLGEAGESSSAFVRMHIPAKGLAKRGWQVGISSLQFQDEHGLIRGAAPALDGKGLGPLPPTKYVVMRRLNEPDGKLARMGKMIETARRKGQYVFLDLDDDPWNLPEWNPAYGLMSEKELAGWAKDMQTANGVLTTTPALGMSIADHVKVPVHLCANGVDTERFKPYMEWPHDPLRIGWMGTTDYRGEDFKLLCDPLREALEGQFRSVELWHLGARPELPSVHDLLGTRFPVQIREIQWMSLGFIHQALSSLDSALIPQLDHPFNQARSNVSGLQMMAAGVPFVASATQPYMTLWRQGGGYAIENSYDNWLQAIRMMILPEYEDARRDIRTAGLVLAQRYTPENVAADWEKAFRA